MGGSVVNPGGGPRVVLGALLDGITRYGPGGVLALGVGGLAALGFVRGTHVRVLRRAPFGDPVEYGLRGTRVSLRRSEAAHIRVRPMAAAPTPEAS